MFAANSALHDSPSGIQIQLWESRYRGPDSGDRMVVGRALREPERWGPGGGP